MISSRDFVRFYPSQRLLRLRLECLLAVAPDHDDAEKGANHGRAEQNQNHGDANGPNAGRKQLVEGVAVVDKGLCQA